jgi:hypothetical protein
MTASHCTEKSLMQDSNPFLFELTADQGCESALYGFGLQLRCEVRAVVCLIYQFESWLGIPILTEEFVTSAPDGGKDDFCSKTFFPLCIPDNHLPFEIYCFFAVDTTLQNKQRQICTYTHTHPHSHTHLYT